MYEEQIIIKLNIKELEILVEESIERFNPIISLEVVGFYVDNDTLELGFSIVTKYKLTDIVFYDLEEPYENMKLFVKDTFIGDPHYDVDVQVTIGELEANEQSEVEIVIV